MKFCPECGSKTGGAKFCPECGHGLADGVGENNVVSRSTMETQGSIDDAVISRSTVKTDRTAIKDAVISHSTITQTETHQHFGESVGTFDTQMELGRTAFEGRNYDEAVDFFNAALKIDSRGFEPWFLKGLSCAELKRTDEAVTNLRRALKSADGHRQRVVDEIKGLVERTARTAMALEAQAMELLSKAHVELQYSYQAKSGAKTQKDNGMMGALALDLFVMPGLGSSMRTTSAVEGIEQKQEADKREAEGRKLEDQAKDILSGAVRQYNTAIRFCDLIIEFYKEDEFSFLKRGEIFLRLKLYPDACRSYEAIIAFNPNNREALRLRGMCYTAQGLAIPPPIAAQVTAQSLQPEQPIIVQKPAPPSAGTPLPQQPQRVAPEARALVQPNIAHAPQAPAPAHPPQQAPSQCVSQMHGSPQGIRMAPCANPCPYCRSEMSFVKERNVWFCGACRRFSDRPAR
jgi:tetratricopeptide (TPR) repeat protein